MEDRSWFQSYDEGVPRHIEYPEIPLYGLLDQAAEKYPDTPCTIFKGAKISYKDMNEITDRLAAGLADLGIKKGDRVGIFMPNTPQFVMAYFAAMKLGAVIVATNPLYSPREIEHQVQFVVSTTIVGDALSLSDEHAFRVLVNQRSKFTHQLMHPWLLKLVFIKPFVLFP